MLIYDSNNSVELPTNLEVSELSENEQKLASLE